MKKQYVIVLIVSILLGLMLALQYKIVQKDYLSGMIPSAKLVQLKNELETLREEKSTLITKLDEMQQKIDIFVLEEADDNVMIGSLNNELSKYKMLAGETNLQGEGVAIYLGNDPTNSESTEADLIADYSLILFIINELNAAGAEALSVNDERYIPGTEIRGTGDSVVVNGVSLNSPFIIKAIGNNEVLSSALEQRFGIIDVIRKRGYFCEVNKLKDLRIMRSTKIYDWKYAKPKIDEEK